jgi:hypothetical protein
MGKIKSTGNKPKAEAAPKLSGFITNFSEGDAVQPSETKKKSSRVNNFRLKTIKKAKNDKSAILKVHLLKKIRMFEFEIKLFLRYSQNL